MVSIRLFYKRVMFIYIHKSINKFMQHIKNYISEKENLEVEMKPNINLIFTVWAPSVWTSPTFGRMFVFAPLGDFLFG